MLRMGRPDLWWLKGGPPGGALSVGPSLHSDDFPEGVSHFVACQPEGTGCRFSGGLGVHERGLPSRSAVLNGDDLDASAEDCVPLFKLVECGVQLDDHGFGVVSEDDQFHVDLFVIHLYASCDSIPRDCGSGIRPGVLVSIVSNPK